MTRIAALTILLPLGSAGLAYILPVTGTIIVWASGGRPTPVDAPPPLPATAAAASLWMLLHSFSSECTAMTGVEAVSNGVMAFREPRARSARTTLTIIIGILMLMLAGIAHLADAHGIGRTHPGQSGYESYCHRLSRR